MATPFQPAQQHSVSEFLTLALGSMAVVCQIVLFALGRLFENAVIPESQYVSVFFPLLPTLLLAAMGSVLLALSQWRKGITGWVYVGLTMSMAVLVGNALWFASPALFPPR